MLILHIINTWKNYNCGKDVDFMYNKHMEKL